MTRLRTAALLVAGTVLAAWIVPILGEARSSPLGAGPSDGRLPSGAFTEPAATSQDAWCGVSDGDLLAFAPSTWKIVRDLGAQPVAAAGIAAPDAPADERADDDDDVTIGDAGGAPDGLDVASVSPVVETGPVSEDADDPAIWVHPTDPAQSLVIGTDKSAGLFSWNLAGQQVQFVGGGLPNNVDVRYGFPLKGTSVDIVATGDESGNRIRVYGLNPATRQMSNIGGPGIAVGVNETYGFCLYRSPVSSKFYAFVNDKDGQVEQWELGDLDGVVGGVRVRAFDVGSQTEGCVADDTTGALYIGEEGVGIWKYGAEPGDGSARTKIDGTGGGGHLKADVEGVAIYQGPGGSGYLLASSQGDSTFAVYDRQPPHAFVTSFTIGAGNGIDAVGSTDGIDVTNVALNGAFPQGMFVAHDGSNDQGANNYKLVRWPDIAASASPPLAVDTSVDPRGGTSSPPPPGGGPPPTATPPGVTGGHDMQLAPGETVSVTCPNGKLSIVTQTTGAVALKCGPLTGPPDPTQPPVPTATPVEPTARPIAPPTSTPGPGGLLPPDPPGRQVPDSTFNPRRIPIELQAWWAPNFGHIHAAAMLPLGQDVSGTLDFDVRIVLHDNPSHLVELRIDTDQGVFKKIPLNLRCPYDGRTSTNCAFNVPVSLDTTKMTNGWREIRIRATSDSPDGKRFLNSSGIPLRIVNGGGGGGSNYNRWCNNRSLIGRGWYDGFGYTNAVIECVPLETVSGVHTFNVRAQQTSNHLQVALDKTHYIPAVGSWPEVAPSAGRILFDRAGNFQSFMPITVDTRQLANGWHSLAVTSTGDGGTSSCAFCNGEHNNPAGVAKIWFFVQN